MGRKTPGSIWNKMPIKERLVALEGGYLSESDKDYRYQTEAIRKVKS